MSARGITPFLWFDTRAEEAARFYVSIFNDSAIDDITHYTAAGPKPAGSVMTMAFHLRGEPFVALNGGPDFSFTPAVSFVVPCETQAEIDTLWDKLIDGGSTQSCGWVRDRFGLSWQIVPANLNELVGGDDSARAERVMRTIFTMDKLDIARLQAAYDQREAPATA